MFRYLSSDFFCRGGGLRRRGDEEKGDKKWEEQKTSVLVVHTKQISHIEHCIKEEEKENKIGWE